ncbi:cache and HAMP domain-containing protein [Pseudanabaena sp. 'Roaring Creek']|uniref:PDC sensor domain-containing protein n=1 Tax=Pseudanabaena sp. 'Roaring Creek' TaxID=1681830 RepID=UPI0006D7E77F|nr:cache and HAMP domain-containing protein [Pseudanabaena sp. 'Roaring Creek']
MFSIQNVIQIVLTMQITVAVGVTSWVSFQGSERAVQKLTLQLCENLNYRVEQEIKSYLQESIQINQAVTIALSNGTINPDNISQVQQNIFDKARELNIKNILFYGNENGTMVGIERMGDSKFLLRIREDSNSPNRPTYELNSNGVRGKMIMNEIYDHRDRPWYMGAKEAGKAIWSPVFVSTTDGELTTTRATPIYKNSGEFQGVVGINVSLNQIKQFMLHTRPTDQWNVFLVESNGSLMASTSESPIFEKDGNVIKRFEASKSKDIKLQSAGLAIQKRFGGFDKIQDSQVVEFDFNGQTYIVSTHKLSKTVELDWTVGIIVPKAIFMQYIDANNRATIMITVVMLSVNILIGLAVSAWLLRPIKNLMTAAKEIEEESFNSDKLESVAHRKDEIGQMARVFQEMGSTIVERQNGMKTQLKQLREEKDEAKKAAIASQMGQNNSIQSILSRSRAARGK